MFIQFDVHGEGPVCYINHLRARAHHKVVNAEVGFDCVHAPVINQTAHKPHKIGNVDIYNIFLRNLENLEPTELFLCQY